MTTQANAVAALETLAQALRGLPGVQEARVWSKVPGKERLYVDLTKHNGGRAWNGGVGRTAVISAADPRIVWDNEWAGAATRDRHTDLGTIDGIKSVRDSVFADWAAAR